MYYLAGKIHQNIDTVQFIFPIQYPILCLNFRFDMSLSKRLGKQIGLGMNVIFTFITYKKIIHIAVCLE
jgi:hypothetical protein